MTIRLHYFVLILTALLPHCLFAQEGYEHLSTIAHGAGRTYVVTSRGLAAVGLDPALLDYGNDKTLEIQVFPISSYGLDAGPSFRDANSLASVFDTSNHHFTHERRIQITDLISNGKLSGRGDVEVLGISYKLPTVGTFAFTWTSHAAVRADVPQDFIDFFLKADSPYYATTHPHSVENFDLQGSWYNEYSASFAKTLDIGNDTSAFLKTFSFGGSLKYVSGIAYIKVDQGNYIRTEPGGGRVFVSVNFDERSAYSSNFDPTHIPNHFSFDFVTANSAGSGVGFDLGAVLGLFSNKHGTPTVLFGISATDIGSITWNKNATERIADHLYDSIIYQSATKPQDITDSLGKFSGTAKNLSSFTTPLPSMFRVGLQIDLDAMSIEWGVFTPRIAVEYANGLTGLVGSLKYGRLGAGLTLERTGPVGLRLAGGFVIEQGASDITLGAGVTLFNFLNVDVASAHVGQFLKSGSSGTDLAISVRAAF